MKKKPIVLKFKPKLDLKLVLKRSKKIKIMKESKNRRGLIQVKLYINSFLTYLGFLSRKLAIRRTAGERRGYFFNSSLPLPLVSQTVRN